MAELDYYKVLGLSKGATTSEIKKRYQFLSKKYHSDHGGDDSIMSLINEAYKVLSNPSARFKYDHQAHDQSHKTNDSSQSAKKTPPPTVKAKSKSNKNNAPVFVMIAVVLVIAVLAGGGIYLSHKKSVDYQANVSKVTKQAQQLNGIYQQYSSLPSSTTQLQSAWDSYYSGLISQVQTINTASNTTYSSSAINNLNSEVQTASASFINLLNLDKSATDMQFQIQTDQNKVTTDKSLVQEDTADDDSDCALAEDNPYITCDRSLENQANSYLTAANTQLSTDQQSQKTQQSQSAVLGITVLGEMGKMNTASNALTK
ncbi:MAG TPA: DnaJ domain-containing protein [Patescibacteria group bacterium]|nr:DnaJ domain-containing protein [Patescibacteria group bacterium]